MSAKDQPVVIGLYGLPGCGKSYYLNELKVKLASFQYALYEGSERIGELVSGGLAEFQGYDELEKTFWRRRAIDSIYADCFNNGKTAVVTGHCMFWQEGEPEGQIILTDEDERVYTHIFYLKVAPEEIANHQRNDKSKYRSACSVRHLKKWQEAEISLLQDFCRQHKILFSCIVRSIETPTLISKLVARIEDARVHNETYNKTLVRAELDRIILAGGNSFETVVVMDADRTLASVDTGTLFWKKLGEVSGMLSAELTAQNLFGSPMGYTYKAFRQATFLYEERSVEAEYHRVCAIVAAEVAMYPEFRNLLQRIAQEKHVGAVIVTCGLKRVWEVVLKNEGLSETVTIIGGGRLSDRIVVNADVKADIVKRLRDHHNAYVWAFGDSPLDLDMLRVANKAIVVVGEEQNRSHTMDDELRMALDGGNFCPWQLCLPDSSRSPPRLDTTRLPSVTFDSALIDSIVSPLYTRTFSFVHATHEPATKLLSTKMRDGPVKGPALREAHSRAGHYLAVRFVADIVGIEECPITHVLGHSITGSRLSCEKQTLIIAIMRAGEPMALGVHEAFPEAMFCHAKQPHDVEKRHVQDVATVVLVDAVINTGKSTVDFVQRVRSLRTNVRIIILTGVVQHEAIARRGFLERELGPSNSTSLVALRISHTKFTGTKGTDTGNRLFNTTNLD